MVINENGLITENQNTQEFNEDTPILQENTDFDLISNENSVNVDENTTTDTDVNQIQEKETVETNCLALTVRKDYNLSIFKNSIVTTFRVSWKIAVSTFLLNLMKLFF